LRLVIDPILFTADLRIDSLLDLSITNITATGTLNIDTIAPRVGTTELTIAGNCAVRDVLLVDTVRTSVANHIQIEDNVTIEGNLTVDGFISARPFVSLRVVTSGGTPSSGTTVGTIGTPGTVTLTQLGFLNTVTLVWGTVGTTNLFSYTFTLPVAHPQGTNYIVNGGFQANGALSPSPSAFLTFNVTSATSFSVWVRSSTNILLDGNFYVYTVP
jgi:hypothetical protein